MKTCSVILSTSSGHCTVEDDVYCIYTCIQHQQNNFTYDELSLCLVAISLLFLSLHPGYHLAMGGAVLQSKGRHQLTECINLYSGQMDNKSVEWKTCTLHMDTHIHVRVHTRVFSTCELFIPI